YTLDADELGRIHTGALSIGGTTNGNITVGDISTAAAAGISGPVTITARSHAQTITFTGASYSFPSLTVNADNGIAFTASSLSLQTTVGNLSLNADANVVAEGSDNISFGGAASVLQSAGSLTLSARNGDMTSAGSLELDAASGVTVTDSLTTGGALTVNAGAN